MKSRPPVKLTKPQQECVTYPQDQPLLIRGIPGSGKTTVLLERAEYLLRHGEHVSDGPKVLFLTYSNLLTRYIQQLALENGSSSIQAQTFHGWGLQLLGDIGITSRHGVVTDDHRTGNRERTEFIKYACNTVAKYHSELTPPAIPVSGNRRGQKPTKYAELMAKVKFLSDEFEWIKGLGKNKERYMSEPRTGRGTGVQVQKQHREWIWKVYEVYNNLLGTRDRFDFDDVALLLNANIDRIPRDLRPTHILVDEAQDLTVMQLKAIARLALRSLTIAADKGQSIYQRNFSWAQLGINIRGRSRSLSQSFRSTRQIIRLANSLQRHDPLVLKRDEEFVPAAEPDIDGPMPELYMAPTLVAQMKQVVDWVVQRRRAFPDDTIGVIVRSRRFANDYAEALNEVGITPQILKEEEGADVVSPGVKLVTFHSAKGLEFDHVAVTGLRNGTVPARPPREVGDEDIEQHLATERRKVYVAMTRARLTLALFSVGPKELSPFITELDASLYTRVCS